MYQIFSHIGSTSSGTLPHPGTEGVKTTQFSDISYFVLFSPKRFSGGNSTNLGGVYEVCGTRVVHFSANVVHVFKCTTPRNQNHVSPLKSQRYGWNTPNQDYF